MLLFYFYFLSSSALASLHQGVHFIIMSTDSKVQRMIPRNGSTNGPIFKRTLQIKSILKNYNPFTHPQHTAYNRNIQSAVCLAMNCANLIYGTTVFVEAVWLKQRVIKGPTRKNLSTILLSEIY